MSTGTISEARLAANRANAQKSTGPKTAEGKAAVANNAYKHGLRSERNPLDLAADAALPHEQTQFLKTLEALKADLAPVGQLETLLLERLAQLDLRLQRALRMETAHLDMNTDVTIAELTAAGSTIATDTGSHRNNGLSMLAFLRDPNALTLIGRYESRLSREFARTLTQFHQAQKLRKQTQRDIQRPQHTETGTVLPSEIDLPSSQERARARAESPQEMSVAGENSAEQTQLAAKSQPTNKSMNRQQVTTEKSNLAQSAGKQAA